MKVIGLVCVGTLLFLYLVRLSAATFAASQEETPGPFDNLQTQVAGIEETIEAIASSSPSANPDSNSIEATPTPIKAGDGIEILYYELVEWDAFLTIYGDYRNVSDETIYAPQIVFTLFDEDGNVLGTLDASPVLPQIEPDEVAPFEGLAFADEFAGRASESFTLCETRTSVDDDATEQLEVQDLRLQERSDRALEVSGVVANHSAEAVERVRLIVVVRTDDGRYAGSDADFIEVPVPPGKTARFDLRSRLWGVSPGEEYSYEVLPLVASSVSFSIC